MARTERAMGHLEGASKSLEDAAKLQLTLLRRMVPIVEDLGEFVRHSLERAREEGRYRNARDGSEVVIEVKSEKR